MKAPRAVSKRQAEIVLISGLSGSGKSHAANALEDLGFFCVDNLPTKLLPDFVDFLKSSAIPRAGLVVDMREPGFVAHFGRAFEKLKRQSLKISLIFLEASDPALIRRFSETRRAHPLAPHQPVRQGLREERQALTSVRRLADLILDTSSLSVHQLRGYIQEHFDDGMGDHGLVLTVLSFGFKLGLPTEADLVFDVRFLKNPHFDPRLRRLTGLDPKVVRFLKRAPGTVEFQSKLLAFLSFVVPKYVEEGKAYLTIAIGCTGGRHRSVMIARQVADELAEIEGVTIRLRHRDIKQK
ncbi:MAG: RNase adapter RapZ [Vicinamibacteria bacterium]|nr:RNase adapter RapZ [Vicinamibacteria bacterium]